ncbi:MAG: twin-arginine translocase TatA/TatE family subunit [Deltaproteobacteria bacterium]|jgi:sec-independent protein translocase protein TatA|nr:twin-arginine translocase TatA/TatE family subunit [Deltaproteobacteria bacterium]
MGISIQHILVVLVVGLVLFGAKRLPEVGSAIGKAIRNFKQATSELDETDISPSSGKKDKQDVSRES